MINTNTMQFKQKIVVLSVTVSTIFVLLASGAIATFIEVWYRSLSVDAQQLRKFDIAEYDRCSQESATPSWKSKTNLQTSKNCTQHYKLLLLVNSSPENYLRRIGIRTTWAKKWHKRVDLPKWKTMFLLGRSNNTVTRSKVLAEHANFGDLIIGDIEESLQNLSLKAIMGFEWATHYCQNFDYILKSDDDVFVNIENLFAFLNQTNIPKTRLYAGNVHFQALPDRTGRYKVSFAEYPYNYFPRYASGGGYIVSKDVAAMLIESHDTENYLKVDDAYIGMLALANGIDARHDDKFKGVRIVKNVCNCDEKMILIHRASTVNCMIKLYYCNKLPPTGAMPMHR